MEPALNYLSLTSFTFIGSWVLVCTCLCDRWSCCLWLSFCIGFVFVLCCLSHSFVFAFCLVVFNFLFVFVLILDERLLVVILACVLTVFVVFSFSLCLVVFVSVFPCLAFPPCLLASPCLVLPFPILSYPVFSCLVLSYLVVPCLFCLVLFCLDLKPRQTESIDRILIGTSILCFDCCLSLLLLFCLPEE